MRYHSHNDRSITEPARPHAALPRPIQEHLGQQLRATLFESQEKPAFLGDPALPTTFDDYLHRLRLNERARERRRASEYGIAAVAAALQARSISKG